MKNKHFVVTMIHFKIKVVILCVLNHFDFFYTMHLLMIHELL